MPDGPRQPDFVVRVVVILIAATVVVPMILSLGRGVMCAVRGGGCPFEELQFGMEQFASYIGTLIALLMALLNRKD